MTDERLKRLEQRREKINLEMKRLRQKAAQEERKRDSRRKIIAGAIALKHCEVQPRSAFAETLRRLLSQYVEGDTERALFDLPHRESGKESGTVTNGDARSGTAENDDDGRSEPDSREEAAPEMKEETRETANTE